MVGANAELARRLLEKAKESNVVQALVEAESLHTRNAQRWIRLDTAHLNDFPILTIEYLKDLTFGTYQIKLSPSYVQDKLRRDGDEEFQIEMLRHENRLPWAGLIRVRVYSRFRNATKYQLWIAYRSTLEEIENDEMEEHDDPIQGHYCTCKSGSRTVGTCAHIASVIWYIGYARHQANICYPSARLIESVRDAANRPQE